MFWFLDTHEVYTMCQEVGILHSGLEVKSEVGVCGLNKGIKLVNNDSICSADLRM